MTGSFEKLFEAFKNLSDDEKVDAIIEYLKYDIDAVGQINRDINNSDVLGRVEKIIDEESGSKLDLIYQLLHVLNEQVEGFAQKIADDFFEDE